MSFSPKHFSTVDKHTKFFVELLKKYYNLFNSTRKESNKIVDIGTGPGSTLLNLVSLMPQNYEEIICIDVDDDMIDFFSSLPKDPRISSKKLDIQTGNLPIDIQNRFDFALATNSLMYLDNPRQVFKNTNKMLKSGGELFFAWSKRCDLHDIYRELSKIDGWYPYTSDFKNWNSYFDNESPTSTIRIELESTGFDALKIEEISDNVFEFEDEKSILDLYDSLDHISKRIPKYDIPKYKEDFHLLVKSRVTCDRNAAFGRQAMHPFPLLVVAAAKK